MSAVLAELQKAVVDLLKADTDVAALVGNRVFDDVPGKPVFPYLSLGPVDQVDDDADGMTGQTHTIQLDIWSRKKPRLQCITICDAAKKALHRADPDLATHAASGFRVRRVSVIRDADGVTNHGIITLEAFTEDLSDAD